MENFIYSINVTMPIFLVMVLGYFLKQIGMLDDNFVTVANRFNFKVTLPFMLFRDISTVDIKAVFDLKYVLFCAIVSTICFWTVWAGAKLFLKDKSMRGAFVQASFRGSAAVMGMAFIENIYGSSAMGPLMIVGAVPLYNIYSVLVLTFEDNEDAMMNRILSFINTRDEITQMSDLNNHLLNFKGILIDEVQRVIIRENQEIELTYTEFEILKFLAKHPGIVFSKEQIYDIVWKESYSGDYNIVMSHIRNIREKIEDNPSKPIYIQTVWGVGYRFNKNLIA